MRLTDDDIIHLCQKAIQTKSYSGQEEGVAKLLQKQMLDWGFDSAVIDKYGSLIGTINGKRSGKTILMDGHIDTVDVVDAGEWKHDPFGGEIVDGRLYGRGAADMKSSVATMIGAVARFAQATGRNFSGKVCVSCTVHEECFEGVSSRSVSEIVKPDFVIIGEATSGTVKIGQRGRAEVVVETEGVSCHSSNPEEGVNAVYLMSTLIEEIRKIVPNEHPVLGKGILELTDIVSTPYPGSSVLPRLCRATFDRRILVGETEETILGQINDAIKATTKKDARMKARCYIAEGEQKCWTGETIKAKRYFPAWCYSESDPMISSAIGSLAIRGLPHKLSHYSFCTNGSHFCGEKGILGIGYGPGEEYLAHVRDEYIEIQSIVSVAKGLQAILSGLLGG